MKKIVSILFILFIIFVVVAGIYLYYPKPLIVAEINKNSIEKEFYQMDLELPEGIEKKYPEIWTFTSKQISDFDKEYGDVSPEDASVLGFDKGRKYEFSIVTNVATTSKTVSYIVETYRWTGGAHGGTDVNVFTYDQNNKIILASDLFTNSNWKKNISEKARIYFKMKFENDNIDETTLLAGTEPNENNFNTWFLRGDELVFVFGQYSIGPYVLGVQEFPIKKDEIKDILRNIF